ncbi:MAG: STAS domain-containing protein [Bacteriovoracaceae bacterium]|nr:STAS domain-containing protein [Bacteriovoracaceae bacterium]
MSMQAKMIRDAQGNIVIHMQGDLNYEHSIPFRQELQNLATNHPNATITIDLGAIDFVGSSGICHFVETLKLIKETNKRSIALDNVKLEFVKVFKLYGLEDADLLAQVLNFDNDETENLNRMGGKTRTFEN